MLATEVNYYMGRGWRLGRDYLTSNVVGQEAALDLTQDRDWGGPLELSILAYREG